MQSQKLTAIVETDTKNRNLALASAGSKIGEAVPEFEIEAVSATEGADGCVSVRVTVAVPGDRAGECKYSMKRVAEDVSVV